MSLVAHTLFPGSVDDAKVLENHLINVRIGLECGCCILCPRGGRPAQVEIAKLLEQLPPDKRERLMREAQLAARVRLSLGSGRNCCSCENRRSGPDAVLRVPKRGPDKQNVEEAPTLDFPIILTPQSKG